MLVSLRRGLLNCSDVSVITLLNALHIFSSSMQCFFISLLKLHWLGMTDWSGEVHSLHS